MPAIVRYSEIGTKSDPVRTRMRHLLRQRIEDRLEYEEIPYERISAEPGRIIIQTSREREAAKKAAEVPGVASASPAVETEAELEEMKEAVEEFEIGESFGVDVNRAGEHDFGSQEAERELGAHVEEVFNAEVDLDNPDTWVEADIRFEKAYIFVERFKGIGGLPVGTQDELLALVSGGIDSPVAAFRMMKRGADVTPIYFYNRPIAAEDDLLRFQETLKVLEKFHPGKKWRYYVVDMEEVNRELMEVGKGRMILHRIVMFRVAERIAEEDGFRGIVTGESLGQKSSQTAPSLESTTRDLEKPVHRPLLGMNKNEVVEEAKEIGSFELSKIDSACRTMAPENPATYIKRRELEELKREVDVSSLVEVAYEAVEEKVLK